MSDERVSIDGSSYAIVDGEWTHVGFAGRDPDMKPFSLPEGHVSFKGAVYAVLAGELEAKGAADAQPFSLPDGHVSVDGALYRIVDGELEHA